MHVIVEAVGFKIWRVCAGGEVRLERKVAMAIGCASLGERKMERARDVGRRSEELRDGMTRGVHVPYDYLGR